MTKEHSTNEKHHLGFVLSYRVPNYIRATTLKQALQRNPSLSINDAINESPDISRYFQTIRKIIRIKKTQKAHVWFVNFRGHEIYWPARWLVGKKSKIVFDELVSPYDAWVNERKTFKKNSLLAIIVYWIEKSILKNADSLFTDSKFQAEYYADLFKVPVEKFTVIRGSVDEKVFSPETSPKFFNFPEPFVIFTYGTFIPLQGMDLILKAAEILKNQPIHFLIAGGKGKKLSNFLNTRESHGLTNISHLQWINFTELPSYMRGAGLCLGGPFGGTPQATRVITGKALQFLACECPTVIGVSAETKEIFTDKKNCLLVNQGNPEELASTILWAYQHQEDLKDIAREGRLIYEQYYSMDQLSRNLNSFIDKIIGMSS